MVKTLPAPRKPKHERVKDHLRRQIMSGELQPGAKLPPDSELHKRFKVHRLTAVRALTDLVREGLIVRRRGSGTYVADQNVVPPVWPGRALNVGIVWRSSVTPERLYDQFLGLISQGAAGALGFNAAQAAWLPVGKDGLTRAVWEAPERGVRVECLGESQSSQVRHPPIEALRAGGYGGLVALGILEDAFLDQMLALDLPLVLADALNERLNERADQVYVDPQQGYQQAVRYFAALGLTRIHFLAMQISLPAPATEMTPEAIAAYRGGRVRVDPDSYLRCGAYRQAMDECGLPVPESAVHLMGARWEKIDELAARLAVLPEAERPQAVICHDWRQAEDLIGQFERRGLPLQGAGAAHNDRPGKALPIRVDLQAVGATALDLLLSRMQRPKRPFLRVGIPLYFEPARTAESMLGSKRTGTGAPSAT